MLHWTQLQVIDRHGTLCLWDTSEAPKGFTSFSFFGSHALLAIAYYEAHNRLPRGFVWRQGYGPDEGDIDYGGLGAALAKCQFTICLRCELIVPRELHCDAL